MKNDYSNQQQGFTYIETIIALGLSTFILIATFALYQFSISQQEFTLTSYLTGEYANRTVEEIVKEVRNARQGDNGAYIFESLLDQEFTFYSNADRDAEIERIRYFLDGTELKKGVINPTTSPVTYPVADEVITTVTDYVQNGSDPVFYYYNEDWPNDTTDNPLSANRLLDTKFIEVHLFLNSNPNNLKSDYEVRSQVQIRTLKDNL